MKITLPFKKLFLFILPLIFLFACKPNYYLVADFDNKTKEHKKVAVLPVEMVFTGKKPEKLTDADIRQLEEAESLAFQISLFNGIITNANTRKKITTVDFQPYQTTNKILSDNRIALRDSWTKDPKELAAILGVDAVVKETVIKQRYMSDLASYGIQLGYGIISQVGGPLAGAAYILTGGGRTNDIDSQCSLFSSQGDLLWKDMYKAAADWSRPANAIIDDINYRFGKRFPYKKSTK